MGIFRSLCSFGLATSVVFAAAVPTKDAALVKRSTNCDGGPGWAFPVLFIGGDTTGRQCETQFGHDYTPITGIEVWRKGDDDGGRIAGLQFTYASGTTSAVYGHEDTSKYPSATLNLKPGETIKSAILYGDGEGEWLGHIYMETSQGRTFDAGRDTKSIKPYGIDVGSGLLLGAWITAAKPHDDEPEDIKNIAFLFLGQQIDHISIRDIHYKEDPADSTSGINVKNFVVGEWFNHANSTAGYSLSPTYAVTSSYSYSQGTSWTSGYSFSVEISAELFEIGLKAGSSFSWEKSSETASTTATTSATSIACVASGTLQPNKGVKVVGTYQTGSGTWSYDSSVTVHLKDGTDYQYTETGQFTDVAYNGCRTTWEDANDPTIQNSPGLSVLQKRDPAPTKAPALPRGFA